jgi:hypothetical protein
MKITSALNTNYFTTSSKSNVNTEKYKDITSINDISTSNIDYTLSRYEKLKADRQIREKNGETFKYKIIHPSESKAFLDGLSSKYNLNSINGKEASELAKELSSSGVLPPEEMTALGLVCMSMYAEYRAGINKKFNMSNYIDETYKYSLDYINAYETEEEKQRNLETLEYLLGANGYARKTIKKLINLNRNFLIDNKSSYNSKIEKDIEEKNHKENLEQMKDNFKIFNKLYTNQLDKNSFTNSEELFENFFKEYR